MINKKRQEKFARRKIAALRLQASKNQKEPEMPNAREHNLYHLIATEVSKLSVHVREHLEEGLTIGGVWCLIEDTTSKLVKILERIKASGEDKKELVIQLVEQLYEEEIKPVDLPWVPNTIEDFVDETIGKAIRPTVSWLIDKICGDG